MAAPSAIKQVCRPVRFPSWPSARLRDSPRKPGARRRWSAPSFWPDANGNASRHGRPRMRRASRSRAGTCPKRAWKRGGNAAPARESAGTGRNERRVTASSIVRGAKPMQSGGFDGLNCRPVREADHARNNDDSSGVTRVPFNLVNNHSHVNGSIDGKPARFLVDTNKAHASRVPDPWESASSSRFPRSRPAP